MTYAKNLNFTTYPIKEFSVQIRWISDHVSKPKFYYIENLILLHFFGSKPDNESKYSEI